MFVYAVSKGEGKNLHVKNTKFFINPADAKEYRESLTFMGDYHIICRYDRKTNELLHETVFYIGKSVSEKDKKYFDLNQMACSCEPYYVKCSWERRPHNDYIVTPIEVN